MRKMLKVTMVAAGLAAALGGCGGDIDSQTNCSDSKCPPNLPFYGSGNYRSCHDISDPSTCYLQSGDGVIYQCDANCDCTGAQSQINAWCNSLQ